MDALDTDWQNTKLLIFKGCGHLGRLGRHISIIILKTYFDMATNVDQKTAKSIRTLTLRLPEKRITDSNFVALL